MRRHSITDGLLQILDGNTIFTPDTLLMYWQGFLTTVERSLLALLSGLVFALALAAIRSNHIRWLSWPIYFYCYVFRGTPLLVQLYIYYGITYVDGIPETIWWQWFKNPFYSALLAFTLNTCAYTTEILYGAIAETDHRELEAAKACGMSWWISMRRIVLPAYANEMILPPASTSPSPS